MFSQSAPLLFLAANLQLGSVLGFPLVKRNKIDDHGSSAAVQWGDAAGNHIRNYHIRDDCKIMESLYEPPGSGWTQELPFCGNPGSPIVGTIIKTAAGGPEVIQIFYRDRSEDAMRSIFWTQTAGWINDAAFNSKLYNTTPSAAVAWKTAQGTKNIRLYGYTKSYMLPLSDGDPAAAYNEIYEFAWTAGIGWGMTNGGKRLLYGTGDNPMERGHGSNCENPLTALDPTPYYVNRATWTAATGWQERGVPHHDLTGFYQTAPLAAISWGQGTSAGEQIRLYISWRTQMGVHKYKDFQSDRGTWHEGQALPDFARDRILSTQPSAVVWTYRDASNVHTRLYNARCHVANGCRPYIHEIQFDTGLGWRDSRDLDAEPA